MDLFFQILRKVHLSMCHNKLCAQRQRVVCQSKPMFPFTTNSCFVHAIIFQGWIYLHCYQCLESVLPCLFWCKDYSVKQSRAGHHSGLCVRGNPGKSITYYMYNFKNIFNALSKSFKVFHCYETCSSYFSICSFFLDINDINFSDCS